MKKILVISLITLMVGQTMGYAFWGQGPDDGNRKRSESSRVGQKSYRPFKHLSEELGLTDEQKASIKKIKLQGKKDLLPVRNRIAELRLDLEEASMADTPQKGRIKSLVRQIEEQEILVKEKGIDSMFAIRDILTAEQREKLEDLHLFDNFLGHDFYGRPPKGGPQGPGARRNR